MHGVELTGFLLGQVHHLGGDDLQTGGFETGIDLADDVLRNCVGLDDGEGTFDSHDDYFLIRVTMGFCRKSKTVDFSGATIDLEVRAALKSLRIPF
ncbi:hypothetical protein SDC9_201939 [bioreactor metagenome]|uniref:Uncharacterized protein n=1 Tax=bioreactor metagenome TaxID=1076179 RepID=A0A645IV23_9ZZZZ